MSISNDDKKLWLYSELRDEVKEEMDLFEEDPAEEFVTASEMIGYYNDAILDARAEILNVYEDYFLDWEYLYCSAGDPEVELPPNVWANKIRAVTYTEGALRYKVARIKNYHKFEKIMWGEYPVNNTDFYSYYLMNSRPGRERIIFVPTPQFSTVDENLPGAFTPLKCWFLRQPNRIPVLLEWCCRVKSTSSAVFSVADEATIQSDLWDLAETGQAIKFTASSANNLPVELTSGTTYYLVKTGTSGQVSIATTKANALAGTTLTLTAPVANGVVQTYLQANQNIIDNTPVDLPEFVNFIQAWVRVRVYDKLKDPVGMASAEKMLLQAKTQMVDSLTQRVPDDDDTISGDFSHYDESSSFYPGRGTGRF